MQTLHVLRDRNARLYLGGVLVSGFGDSAMALAAGIWVKVLTGSDSLAALVTFCFWVPAFADRRSARSPTASIAAVCSSPSTCSWLPAFSFPCSWRNAATSGCCSPC